MIESRKNNCTNMGLKVFSCILIASSLVLLNSCNENDEIQVVEKTILEAELLSGIRVTLPESPFVFGTRTAHSIVSGSMHTDWQLGDTLGIYPIGGDQVAFPISDGEGTNIAKFDGGAWALRSSYQYAAYYPFKRSNVFMSETQLVFDYLGQEQDGNGSLDNLGGYDFLAASAAEPDAEGTVDLILNHIGCFVRMQLTIPEANTLRSLRITSDNSPFVIKGTVDLSSATPSLIATQTSSYVDLSLQNISVEAGGVATLYMMMAPVDHSGSKLTFTVCGNSAASYSQTINSGKNLEAGSAYNYAVSLNKDDSPYEAVDLGLPSGLKWASYNIGATSLYDRGDFFAWGEVEPKDYYEKEYYSYWYKHSRCDYVPDGDCDFYVYTVVDDYIDLGDDISGTEYDAARHKWGRTWRMPTISEFEELKNNCTWTKETVSEVIEGGVILSTTFWRVTGRNGNSIILMPGGYPSDYGWGSFGVYWLSTKSFSYSDNSQAKTFTFDYFDPRGKTTEDEKWMGHNIRPVTE